MKFGRILAFVLSVFLCLPMAWADDEEDEELKVQIIQVLKENELEIYSEAMKEFQNMDTNDDGVVNLQEFINFQSYGTAEQKEQLFNLIDDNHDGKLKQNELWLFIHKGMKKLK